MNSATLKVLSLLSLTLLGAGLSSGRLGAQSSIKPPRMQSAFPPNLLDHPLSLVDALNLAEAHNSDILRAGQDLKAAYGIAIQTQAIALPKVRVAANYQILDSKLVQQFPGAGISINTQTWNASVILSQSIFEGGRIIAGVRGAMFTREQAIFNYQTVLAEALLAVRRAYYRVVATAEQTAVQKASVDFLRQEYEDKQKKFAAGVETKFNVLRAEVELANAKTRMIKAENEWRLAKQTLLKLIGYDLPRDVGEDVPLRLSDPLGATRYAQPLAEALSQGLKKRTELAAERTAVRLRKTEVAGARGGFFPSVQGVVGYGIASQQFSEDLTDTLQGWQAGGRLQWDVFDGLYTKGRYDEAKARYRRAKIDVDDRVRQIELEVRQSFSNLAQAQEALNAQQLSTKQAEEALRMAKAREGVGVATQLDVLDAQTALTESRSNYVQALYDYAVAYAELERATGENMRVELGPEAPMLPAVPTKAVSEGEKTDLDAKLPAK